MRDYACVAPTFWTRGSGKKLRGDADAQVVALYLLTCPASTMIGIFYLSLPTLAHETGLPADRARAALARVIDAEIAMYDEEAELVFLPEGARYQVGPRLKKGDNRVRGIERELKAFGDHPFVARFVARYGRDYALHPPSNPFEAPSGRSPHPFEGASATTSHSFGGPPKGLPSPTQGASHPLPKGVEGHPEAPSKPGSGSGSGSFVSASAATPEPDGSAPPHDPAPESTESGEGSNADPGTGDETAPPSAAAAPRTALAAPDDPEPQPVRSEPRKGPRKAKAKAEVECPSSDATGDEVEAFLAQWKITGDEAEIAHFVDYHRSKGSRFRDWGAAWRTWKRNGQRFGRGGTAAPARPPPKPMTEPDLFSAMDRLRNLKPGECVR